MKRTIYYIVLLFLISNFSAFGQTLTQKFYLDFGKSDGTNGNITTGSDLNGNYWNNIVSTESGSPSTKPAGYTVSLVNSLNQSTAFVLETTEAFRANGRNNGALLKPNPGLLGDLAVATATEDYFFIETPQGDKGAFVLKNLDPTKAYKFYVFGSREGTDNRTSVFSINGVNGSHGILQTTGAGIGTDLVNTNDSKVFESGLIVPKANGEILFEVGIVKGGFAYISAMKIEEYNDYKPAVVDKKFYIDFGKNNNGLDGSPTANPDVNNHYWNNMFSNGDGATTEQAGKKVNLVFSDNEPSPYVLETASALQFNGVRNGALTAPSAELLGDMAIATATHDYMFVDANMPPGKLAFKNLNKDKTYRFYIFGSRTDVGNRISYINIAGGTSVTGIHQMGGANMCGQGVNQNTQNIFVSDPIVPDNEGVINLTLSIWVGTFAHINAMKVEELEAQERATAITIGGNDISTCGQTSQMSVTATPENTFFPAVTWSVNNDDVACITTSGKLYPKENGKVVVTATVTFSDLTTLSNSKEITISNQGDEYSLAIMGSSVPYGTGAEAGKGYAQLLAQYLAKNAENSWSSVNISIGGNSTTDILNRWEADLLSKCARYVYYGLSLGNEGVHERGQAAFNSYRDNMQIIIDKTRAVGKVPLMGNNYPRADFNALDYKYVKDLNLLIHEWDLPSVNLLGSIDDGTGKWVTAYQSDNAHPNTIGHAEMYYAFVPSLFDALASGKPQPQLKKDTHLALEKTDVVKRITWTPENIAHSFTLSFSFKTTSTGVVASILNEGNATSYLKIDAEGKLAYETKSATNKLVTSTSLNDGAWHNVSLTHYYALGKTLLYVDGVFVKATSITERLVPIRFTLNDFDDALKSVQYSQLFFHRSGMTADEIAALHDGRMLKSSLEIYSPLDGDAATEKEVLSNYAQSLNTLTFETKLVSSIEEFVSDEDFKEMSIYSMTGQELAKISDVSLKSSDKLLADSYPAGVYVLMLKTKAGNSISKKVIVK